MGNPAIFPFRQRFPDDEIMPPPMPPGMEADPSAFSSDPEEQEIQPEPAPGLMPMPEAPNPAETSTDQQIGNPPPPMPSQNPAAMDGMKKMGMITPDGTNPSAPPPPPPPAQPPAAGTMPPPPPPVGSEASEAPDPTWQGSGDQALPSLAQPKAAMPPPPPPSASAAAWQNLQALGAPPPPPKPNIWQRLGAAALAGAAGYANQRDFKAPPIDTSQGVDNILRPGYAAKLGAYNQQLSAAKDQLNQADKYEDLQSREAQRAALATQESAKAGQLASDAKTRAETAAAAPALRAQQQKQRLFEKMTKGRDLQALPAGAPIPPGWDKFQDPEDESITWVSPANLRKITPELAPFAPGFKDGDTVDRKTYADASAAYNKAQAAENKPDPVKTEVKQLQKNGRPHQVLINSATGAEIKDLGETGERPPMNNFQIGGSADNPSSLAQSVANYEIPFSQAVARLPGASREAIMQQIKAINPKFQESQYPVAQRTEQDAVTGKIGTQANALNTMMGHLNVLNSAADALKNHDVNALNHLANFLGAQTGNSAITAYRTIVHRLGPEIGKAYVAGGGTAGERGTNEEDFADSLGPDQLKGNVGISAMLADSKINALQDQYKRGTYGRGQQQLISDEAQQARQALAKQSPVQPGGGRSGQPSGGGGSGQIVVTDPSGTPHKFATQAQADAFKKLAHIQ